MRFSTACLALTALAAPALALPTADHAVAKFENPAGVSGQVTFERQPKCGAQGTHVSFQFSGFGATAVGPFSYHIHQSPVGADGGCTATGGHFDPYAVPKTPVYTCNPAQARATCEVGDLSGKHGKLNPLPANGPVSGSYHDVDVELTGANAIVGRSVVVHNAQGDRIACANIV
ncbi:Superoxide dismutase [Dimargaris cristalligena]|uniref:Superoxide dismutase n=1 Tax=Dimargaris cristalligena TaxID=215637 RepID=A0A4P9ZXE1_9FUNG|nr:Superoxide dismutase [Dimargaris cristalligena]RKP38334.1 superoxide dismutase [Dimargaris cristalligena]|eukprot:RKP38334.1 superoxide dismutase [Dimargaris cristalligena]